MRAVRADAEYLPHPVVIALVASAQAVSQFTHMVSPIGSDLFDKVNRKLGNVWTTWARYFEKTHRKLPVVPLLGLGRVPPLRCRLSSQHHIISLGLNFAWKSYAKLKRLKLIWSRMMINGGMIYRS